MKITAFLIGIISVVAQAKIIYFADEHGVVTSETVDPVRQVWYIKNYVFNELGIDSNRFTLAQKTSSGYQVADDEEYLGNFGDDNNAPLLLYIVANVGDGEQTWLFSHKEKALPEKTSKPAPPCTPVKEAIETKKEGDDKKGAEPKKESEAKKEAEPKKESEAKKEAEPKKESEAKKEAEPKKESEAKKEAEPKKESEAKKEAEPKKESKPAGHAQQGQQRSEQHSGERKSGGGGESSGRRQHGR